MTQAIYDLMFKKATHSPSRFRMAGVAFNKKGEILGFASNGFRKEQIPFTKHSGDHVEKKLIERYGSLISRIIILRIGRSGNILPIDPCPKCQKLLDKYGIKVVSVKAE